MFNGADNCRHNAGMARIGDKSPADLLYSPRRYSAGILISEVGSSYCEWKGRAKYYSVRVGDKTAEDAAWYYPDPTGIFAPIKNAVAFYAGMMDACYVGEEKASLSPADSMADGSPRRLSDRSRARREPRLGRPSQRNLCPISASIQYNSERISRRRCRIYPLLFGTFAGNYFCGGYPYQYPYSHSSKRLHADRTACGHRHYRDSRGDSVPCLCTGTRKSTADLLPVEHTPICTATLMYTQDYDETFPFRQIMNGTCVSSFYFAVSGSLCEKQSDHGLPVRETQAHSLRKVQALGAPCTGTPPYTSYSVNSAWCSSTASFRTTRRSRLRH